jgi:hypothetical protein
MPRGYYSNPLYIAPGMLIWYSAKLVESDRTASCTERGIFFALVPNSLVMCLCWSSTLSLVNERHGTWAGNGNVGLRQNPHCRNKNGFFHLRMTELFSFLIHLISHI